MEDFILDFTRLMMLNNGVINSDMKNKLFKFVKKQPLYF